MAKRPAAARNSPGTPAKPANLAKPRTISPERPATPAKRSWAPAGWRGFAFVVLILTTVFYLPALSNGFVNWDDDANITENPNLQQVGKGAPWGQTVADIFDRQKGAVIGNYNPLPILTFAVEKAANDGEFSAELLHFDNVLLHVLTTLLVMLLLWRMGLTNWGALAGGLLFGLHPMRVESVAWATERKDVLFALFFFASLIFYARWLKSTDRTQRTGLYMAMLGLSTLSLFSKVQAVSLPLSMLLLDFWFRRPLNIKLIWEKTPFWLLSLLFGVLNVLTLRQQGSMDDANKFDFLQRLCIGAYSFCIYLGKLIIPYPMSPLYPYPNSLPWFVYAAPVLFIAFWVMIWRLWRTGQRIWVFGTLFFFFNVIFVLQVLGAGQGYLADRFTYVPYFGLFTIAAYYFDRYMQRAKWQTGLRAGLGVLMLGYGIWSVQQIHIWKDGEALWSHVISLEKRTSSAPYSKRGQYYRNQAGNYDAALNDYSQAIGIEKKKAELYSSRGKTYFDMAMSGKFKGQENGLIQKAIDDYSVAAALPGTKPGTKAEIMINRGAAFGARNQSAEALKSLDEGVALDSNNKNGYLNRSIVLFNLAHTNPGQANAYLERALYDYRKCVTFEPYNANVWYESGMIQRSLGRYEEAITALNQAIRLNPDLGLAYLERARAAGRLGNQAAAKQDYQRAQQAGVQLSPEDLRQMGQ